MKLTSKFTQIPDEWWQLVGKYPVVDEDGVVIREKNGKEKTVTISHWTVVLLAKIASFNTVRFTADNHTIGKCTASNAYFADFLNVSQQTVKNTLSDLYALGLLKSYEQREGKKTTKRFLYINEDVLKKLLARDGTPQSTGVVPHEVLPSTPQSTEWYPTEYPNNKEEYNIKKNYNIGFDEMLTATPSANSSQLKPPFPTETSAKQKQDKFSLDLNWKEEEDVFSFLDDYGI